MLDQDFIVDPPDYSVFENQRHILQSLALISNCGVSIFDFYKKKHIFFSPNFGLALGYDCQEISSDDITFLDSKIHPDDYQSLTANGVSVMKLFHSFSPDEKLNYKLISEYRILNANNIYIRVIEQQQILEMDNHDNVWLTLSIIDISPNQDPEQSFKSQLFNFRTGKSLPFIPQVEKANTRNNILSPRELEVLVLVRNGMLSKEISNELSISVKTVNTHRQRILEKLGAGNSMEAVIFASRLGLI